MTGEQPRRNVLVGIIDDGIAFGHERFRSADGTRVEYAWLQDGEYERAGSKVDYGRELNKKQINKYLEDSTHAGAVDEDEFYLRAGLIDFRRHGHKSASWRAAHGTHVMDLACGYDVAEDRRDRPIVCVQLPARTTANTSGGDLTPYAVDALLYIRDRAIEIREQDGMGPLPVVVNFSYGMIGGPHDGTSELEMIIDAFVGKRKGKPDPNFKVVLPAGNSHLSRCHAEVSFPSREGVVALNWRVMPDDRTPSFLDIWLPRRARRGPSRLAVSVTPPGVMEEGRELGEEPNQACQWEPGGVVLCTLQYNFFPAPTARGRFRITLRPTADLDPAKPLAPSGTWVVRLKNISLGKDDLVHAYIQRDESLYGYPRLGRQSYLDDPKYERYDHAGRAIEEDIGPSVVKRAGLISAIATGQSSIVVGGMLRKDSAVAPYSAGGPIVPKNGSARPHRNGPDAMTTSEDSAVHRGVLAAGSRSGSVVAMGGTSVAAPQVTRWVADRLSIGKTGNGKAVRDRATLEEQSHRRGRPRPPSHRGGSGRLKLGSPVVKLPRFLDE